jgi:4,5-dihydroxyphthalate decarboxylase
MSRLQLTLACWDYDRTRALLDGTVQVDGVDLVYLPTPIEETFFRMQHYKEFDVAEMSLSGYVLSLFFDSPPFVAIPVFPSRIFRHSSIYVHADGRIREPSDLRGKRVGIPEYHITAAVWIRGFMAEEYGVPVNSVEYVTGGLEEPGRVERIVLSLPPDIHVTPIGPEEVLSQMLEAGSIDALYSARPPAAFLNGSPRIRRLFPDYPVVEREYFERTGIFPIMHTIVIRREVYEQHGWIAQSLVKAFSRAKELAYRELREGTALKVSIPWLLSSMEEVERLMGRDFWPYGLEKNRALLDTFLRYSHEQGLAKKRLKPEDLFPVTTHQAFKV